MSRTKGSRNKKTLARDAARSLAAKRAAAAKTAPPIDRTMPLDSLELMESTMRHFFFKAKIEESLGDYANWTSVDDAMEKAARWAKEVAVYRHSRLTAMRLAGDPNNPIRTIREDITADQLRDEILAEMERLGLFENAGAPQGIENRAVPVTNGSGEET